MPLRPFGIPREQAAQLRDHYRAALLDDCVPFWLNHSIDREYGGYYTLLGRDGTPYATDKHVWMNGREIWMFSHLYNVVERRPEWLDAAEVGVKFLLAHAFRDDGKMLFRLTRDGRPMSGALSVFTEVFASIALAEYSKAAGDKAMWDRAVRMYEFLMPRLGLVSDTPLLGYPLNAQFHLHSHDMCRMTVAWVFNRICPSEEFEDDLTLSIDSILRRHWKPELKALLENVAMDGSTMLDLPEGRMFHPGHATESAWMLMEIARARQDERLVQTAVDIIVASLNHGWDRQFGGVRYLTNIDWTPTHELEADMKLWWVHGESLYATLLAWALTGRSDLAEWYKKLHDWSFRYFPDPQYGEWYGYLNRDGSPVWQAKASGWKCFFHLPRALLRCWQLMDEVLV